MYSDPRLGAVVNNVSARNLYPAMSGATLGVRGTSPSSWNATSISSGESDDEDQDDYKSDDGPKTQVEYAAMVGASGNALTWWLVLAVMLFLLMFGAKKLGTDSEFSNVKLSVYNVLTISFAAIIGISFFKMVFTRFPVPGLTAIVMAA